MRAIHLARMDKTRPVLVLTRDAVRPYLTRVTVAPITSTIRQLSAEIPLGASNGLELSGVVSLDNITTIPKSDLGRHLGYLAPDQEAALALAIELAFDLDRHEA